MRPTTTTTPPTRLAPRASITVLKVVPFGTIDSPFWGEYPPGSRERSRAATSAADRLTDGNRPTELGPRDLEKPQFRGVGRP